MLCVIDSLVFLILNSSALALDLQPAQYIWVLEAGLAQLSLKLCTILGVLHLFSHHPPATSLISSGAALLLCSNLKK